MIRPRNVLPVHGEIRHLIANADLAKATGLAEENVAVVEDGAVVDLAKGRIRVAGKIDASYIFVDGSTVGDITESELTDRKILGEEGFISVVAAVNLHTRTLVSGPDIHARGFAENDDTFTQIREQLGKELEKALQDGVDDTHRLQQTIRRSIGRWVSQTYRRRPMIVPVVVAT